MTQRNVSIEQVRNTINNWESFNYIKNWEILKWFYDSTSKIFIWKWKNWITTVINKVNSNYINNLKWLWK